MKRTVSMLLVILLCMGMLLSMTGCSSTEGLYYEYKDGQYDKASFIKLEKETWKDDDNQVGTYTINETKITLYITKDGEQLKYASGSIEDGVMVLTFSKYGGEFLDKWFDTSITFCMEGKAPAA